MDIAFHIPEWLLWVAGIGGGLILLGLAILGLAFLSFLSGWTRIWG